MLNCLTDLRCMCNSLLNTNPPCCALHHPREGILTKKFKPPMGGTTIFQQTTTSGAHFSREPSTEQRSVVNRKRCRKSQIGYKCYLECIGSGKTLVSTKCIYLQGWGSWKRKIKLKVIICIKFHYLK